MLLELIVGQTGWNFEYVDAIIYDDQEYGSVQQAWDASVRAQQWAIGDWVYGKQAEHVLCGNLVNVGGIGGDCLPHR